ncbi:MAG: hypothetical protein R3F60_10695 [bacterium]
MLHTLLLDASTAWPTGWRRRSASSPEPPSTPDLLALLVDDAQGPTPAGVFGRAGD